MQANVAVVNFFDEDFEGQSGELANPFYIDEEGRVRIVKEPGGPVAVVWVDEEGNVVMRDVPKAQILGIRAGIL